MEQPPLSRRARIARIRMRVVAGATALFLATLGGVALAGRQPATKTATAATPTYSDDDTYSDDGSSYSAPAPMTTRSS